MSGEIYVGDRVVILKKDSLYHGYGGTVTSLVEPEEDPTQLWAWVDVRVIPGRRDTRAIVYPVEDLMLQKE